MGFSIHSDQIFSSKTSLLLEVTFGDEVQGALVARGKFMREVISSVGFDPVKGENQVPQVTRSQ